MRRLLSTMLGASAEEVRDAEQETLLRLYTDLGRFRFQSSFRTYLYRFCRNTAVDFLRKRQREEKIRGAALREAAGGGLLIRPDPDPDELLWRQERRLAVSRALMGLGQQERLLLLLKDCEGMPIGEIADILDIPSGTVKSRLHRTREKLASALEGQIHGWR